MNRQITLGKETGSIAGHILGDGSITARDNAVFFSNTDISLLSEFSENMMVVFGVEPRIWVQEKRSFEEKTKWKFRANSLKDIEFGCPVGLFYKKICGVLLNAALGNFAIGKDKKITEQIITAPKEFKKALVRAFFDDECTVDVLSRNIRVFQDRPALLEDFRKLLKEFEINSSELHFYLKREKQRYYFNISGFDNLAKFERIIGFTATEKMNKLAILIKKLNESKTKRLCKKEAKHKILEIIKNNSQPLCLKEITKELRNYSARIKWNESTVLKHLKWLVEEKIISRERKGIRFYWSCEYSNHKSFEDGKFRISVFL
ncbi:MAG: LAGLIDADG family homing endonuclease [Candidatus Diapherotrites archaeon]|nr:LAGLIDADG family homing endonuclease [Candidatus Diapherotrites archaeon]